MEALTVQTTTKSEFDVNNVSFFTEQIFSTLVNIVEYADENGYKYNNPVILDTDEVYAAINETSRNARKKLRNAIISFKKNPTLKKVNLFLHNLMKNIMNSDTRYRILKSDKQLQIEEARANYRKLRDQARLAYEEYNTTKGDFYKNRIVVGQKME